MSILESRKSLKLVILASALRNQKKEEEVKPEVNRRKENKEQRSVKQKTEKSSQAKSNSLKRSIKLINLISTQLRKKENMNLLISEMKDRSSLLLSWMIKEWYE